ncbi:MAG: hypothetical protein FK731_08805 [Asgard group archaeon]|nr:hypothetical protein [Asgard group archaeon]
MKTLSNQNENIIPFIVDAKEIPIEAELALIVGVVGDKIKKGGFLKRSKERLTQVSKFYWRLHLDSLNQRIVLIDSLGIFGGGLGVQDLSISNVIARLKAIQDATTIKAYVENLEDANQELILTTQYYYLFDQSFSRSTFDLMRQNMYEGIIDTPLILPSFEQSVSNELIQLLNEIPNFSEIQDRLQEVAREWLAEINSKVNEIERTFAGKIQRLQEDVNQRIEQYKEQMDHKIDSDLEKANQAIYRELANFESSTLGLTGMINPIQEQARKILNEIPSIETPKFQESMKIFLNKSKEQIDHITEKVKELEIDRKNLAKNLNGISQQFVNTKQNAVDDFEKKKVAALNELDELRMDRDRSLSDLIEMRDSIKRNTDDLCKKLQTVVSKRKEAINKSAVAISGNIPTDILISLYLIKFKERDDIRYFVIPPLIKPRHNRDIDYPNAERDSAIIGGKRVADKLAEELVFNRRLKDSLDTLKASNYLATGEFAGAVKQGLDYLVQNKLISKKGSKKIMDLLENLGI